MKPFWKKPQKKRQSSSPPAAKKKVAPKPRPESWTPPHPPKSEDEIKQPPWERKIGSSEGAKSEKNFLKTFRSFSSRRRTWDIWSDFIVTFACAISNAVDKSHYDEREKRYLDIIKKYSKEEQQLFPELAAHVVAALDEDPEQDFLGSLFMELNLGDEHNGQFFTPYEVCQLMADVTENDIVEEVNQKGYITINDPCCGAGATLIAGINTARKQLEKADLNFQNHVLIVGQDIDEIVLLMCYIQTSLLGVAGYFKVGNTFTDPMTGNDSLENYWFTPMYFSSVWAMRRLLAEIRNLSEGDWSP